MADRIHTSTEAEDALATLRHTTKIEYAALARLALSLSLKIVGANVPRSTDFAGKEIRRQSLFGNDEVLFRSLLQLLHGHQVSDDEFFGKQSFVKDHVDHGCKLLRAFFDEAGGNSSALLRKLQSQVSMSKSRIGAGGIAQLDIEVGVVELTGDTVLFELNNSARHANSHLAIMGKPGTGKTQVLLKILTDIRQQSGFLTNFIFFDYKGDVANEQRFIDLTRAQVFRSPRQPLPINPFVLQEYGDTQIRISAKEKAESFSSISAKFGPVQKDALTEAIIDAYALRRPADLPFPDFDEVFNIVQARYDADNKKADTLTAILKDLATFSLFWKHGNRDALIPRVSERTMIVDLHELPVLKELVAYLVIERLYKEMAAMPDSPTAEGWRMLRTVLVIDEAHNYLSQKNPFLQRIIREGRSKGIAVFFASQSPNDYQQKFFDFKELLEFSIIFQCEGVSATAVQDLLACPTRAARALQTELARLRPFQAVSKALNDTDEFCQYRAEPFFKAYA